MSRHVLAVVAIEPMAEMVVRPTAAVMTITKVAAVVAGRAAPVALAYFTMVVIPVAVVAVTEPPKKPVTEKSGLLLALLVGLVTALAEVQGLIH